MGAVSFTIDSSLVEFFAERLPIDTFVETGTYRGDAIEVVKPYFERCFSVEFSEEYYIHAAARFQNDPSVTLLKGDSGVVLADLVKRIGEKSILFWLDAHWCADENTTGEMSKCPLVSELGSIDHLSEESVILIDDARLFLCPPGKPHDYSQWPDLNEVLAALARLSDRHNLMVINDVMVYYPRMLKSDLQHYAHAHGVDWLKVMAQSRDLLEEVDLRDREIEKLRLIAEERLQVIVRCSSVKQRIKWWLAPRLGVFSQHLPRPLHTPAHYTNAEGSERLPSISMVTPSFNQVDFLERTIKSLLEQHYPELQYIVQDGGSEDGTVAILEKYSNRLSHWESAKDTGQAHAINLGFTHATGEIMAYLNSDDLLLPGTLHYVAHYFSKHPDVDIVYGHRVLIDENDREVGRWVLPPHDDHVLSWADYIPQETLFWRRGIWQKAGGCVDEGLRFAMDWDLILRFRDAGAKFVRLPRFLGAFRVHSQQKSSKELGDLGQEEMGQLRKRYHNRDVSDEEIYRHIRTYLLRHVILNKMYRAGVLRY
jgi:glycosyltransferase involved in cell wall biosynthesis